MKQANLYPSAVNGNSLKHVRRETSRYFRNKKRKYVKDKIDELAIKTKNNIIEICIGE
jgi:hypothetical protein